MLNDGTTPRRLGLDGDPALIFRRGPRVQERPHSDAPGEPRGVRGQTRADKVASRARTDPKAQVGDSVWCSLGCFCFRGPLFLLGAWAESASLRSEAVEGGAGLRLVLDDQGARCRQSFWEAMGILVKLGAMWCILSSCYSSGSLLWSSRLGHESNPAPSEHGGRFMRLGHESSPAQVSTVEG